MRRLLVALYVLSFSPNVAHAACDPDGDERPECGGSGFASYSCEDVLLIVPTGLSVSVVASNTGQCIFTARASEDYSDEPIGALTFSTPPSNALTIGEAYSFSCFGHVPRNTPIEFSTEPATGPFRFATVSDPGQGTCGQWELVPLRGFDEVSVRARPKGVDEGVPLYSSSFIKAKSIDVYVGIVIDHIAAILGILLTAITGVSVWQKIRINELKRRSGHFEDGDKPL